MNAEITLNPITEESAIEAGLLSAESIESAKESGSLELLVNLAKEGNINPWDIDIVDVTDRYLSALDKTPRENLREAGRGIFFASVLLRLKSEILSQAAHDALNVGIHEPFEDLLEAEMENAGINISYRDLEQVLVRRNIQKTKKWKKVTLDDLISALKAAEEEQEVKEFRREQRLLFDDEYFITEPEVSDDMRELTHAENLEKAIERARAFLMEYMIGGAHISFGDMVKYLGNWSDAFLTTVFLAHENEIDYEQEEFYGDLYMFKPEGQ